MVAVVSGIPEDTTADGMVMAVVGVETSSPSPEASSTCKSSSTCSCKATDTAKGIMKTSKITSSSHLCKLIY